MRISVLLLGSAVSLTLASCTDKGGNAADGDSISSAVTTASGTTSSTITSANGGTTNSGGITGAGANNSIRTGGTAAMGDTNSTSGMNTSGALHTGGNANTGGTVNNAPAGNTGGTASTTNTASSGNTGDTTNTGGTPGSGGQPAGTGGTTSGGGMPTSGGSTASAGDTASGGTGGGGSAAEPYQGPCDLLAGGCAEAYSVTRAMTASYTGPLFQLGKAGDKNAPTLDIGQTDAHTVDMTTWSDYCGGQESNCVVSKIYAQIHSGDNDLLPAVWAAPWGPNCSAGGYTCAAKFTIESDTGLPILTTVSPQEYALSGDNFAKGVNGGSSEIGLFYNGKPVPNQVYCCGVFGITHKYNANDTFGTDFMLALAHGWKDSGGCCIAVNCGGPNSYCVGAEEEENNDLYDYGSEPLENALVITQFDPAANAVITFLNGTQVLMNSPPQAQINAGTAIHLGGGGDLSQPDPVLMREGFITNALMTASDATALKANAEAFYTSLNYP